MLFHRCGVVGLAYASDIGIGANLLALAWLLHYRKMVSLRDLAVGDELGKSALDRGSGRSHQPGSRKKRPAASLWHGQPRHRPAAARMISLNLGRRDAAGLVGY